MRVEPYFGAVIEVIGRVYALNLGEIADAVGIVRSHIGAVRAGKGRLSLEGIQKICDAFKINVSGFILFAEILEAYELSNQKTMPADEAVFVWLKIHNRYGTTDAADYIERMVN